VKRNRFDRSAILAARAERDRFLSDHYASPIPEELRDGFAGADYYEPDARFVFVGPFLADPTRVAVPSSAGTVSDYPALGIARITVEGHSYDLTVLDDGEGGAFLPFGDATNGRTTYRGGRYVAVELDAGGGAIVDFNRAVNPYCVYDEEYSCPLPPPGNTIAASIEAGERMYRTPEG
jgi:uncharacterized protein (DUF1684 family)